MNKSINIKYLIKFFFIFFKKFSLCLINKKYIGIIYIKMIQPISTMLKRSIENLPTDMAEVRVVKKNL